MAKADRKTITTTVFDPIFTAIENQRRLNEAWLHTAARADRTGNRVAKKADIDRDADAAEMAAWEMARTEPQTATGAAAMLSYITTGPITGLFELGETEWHETAFRTAVASLDNITRRSQHAA
jgi:hypothetical protein